MSEAFELHQPVECKAGIGKITYFEDNFMEVTLNDGTERTFWGPFEGKVWNYVAPAKKEKSDGISPIWDEILNHPAMSRFYRAAQLEQTAMGFVVEILSGKAVDPWDQLNAFQKMQFISVATALPVGVILEAKLNNTLEELLTNR